MPSIQQNVLNQLHQRPKLIVLDTMNFWMDHYLDDLMTALKDVDVLTINEEEARQLSGEYSLVKAAQKILSFGPSYLVIKKGEHGALLFNAEEVFFAPALPLEEVVDPTGQRIGSIQACCLFFLKPGIKILATVGLGNIAGFIVRDDPSSRFWKACPFHVLGSPINLN